MRAHEFIFETTSDTLADGVATAMPTTEIFPKLTSQDPYLQYRFGLALASARAVKNGDLPAITQSPYGEEMVVVSRSKEEEETVNLAQQLYGPTSVSTLVSTKDSSEATDIYKQSPIQPNSKKLGKR